MSEQISIENELSKVLKAIASLKEEIVALSKIEPTTGGYRSTEIKQLATALSKAQGEMPVAGLNKQNPYFKSRYADFTSVVTASRPALSKYGLSVVQNLLRNDDGQSVLHTILLHSSGEWIESRMVINAPKPDIQTVSSFTTYLKRMAYSSLVGVVTGEEDDDGEVAVAESRESFAKGTALNTKYNPKEQSAETLTREQIEAIEYELGEYPDIGEMILTGYKIQSLADIPKSKYQAAITRIREITNLRNGNK
jgi:hypothetical protein